VQKTKQIKCAEMQTKENNKPLSIPNLMLLYGVVGSRMMILTIIIDLQGLKIKIHGIFDVFALYHQIR
jgi:hypothetical protein